MLLLQPWWVSTWTRWLQTLLSLLFKRSLSASPPLLQHYLQFIKTTVVMVLVVKLRMRCSLRTLHLPLLGLPCCYLANLACWTPLHHYSSAYHHCWGYWSQHQPFPSHQHTLCWASPYVCFILRLPVWDFPCICWSTSYCVMKGKCVGVLSTWYLLYFLL